MDNLCEVHLVLRYAPAALRRRAGIEQDFTSEELENQGARRPHVHGGRIGPRTQDSLRGSILACLDRLGLLFVDLTRIAKINELDGRAFGVRTRDKEHILRFDVGVHDAALGMQKFKGVEQLRNNGCCHGRLHRALELNQTQQRVAQWLEYHACVPAMQTFDLKALEHAHNVGTTALCQGAALVGCGDALQQRNLAACRATVLARTLLNLDGHLVLHPLLGPSSL
mmetsp:Transcript_24416/g.43484  ORF Transcript_24416/g.43484 Transcript_24416/m.43484 type:complete len:225 (-) Transcript_24416:81-755(-)